jgi:hypothetical protein
MKVALLLSGLARKVEEGYNQFWKPLIENNDVDVYLHFWEDEEHKEVLNYYSPKKFICEKPFDFQPYQDNITSENDKFARPNKLYNVAGNFYSLPMFWGWQQVYNLVEEEYDYIVRSRYDIGWDHSIDLNLINPDYINVSNHHWPNSEILDDNLVITNSHLASLLFKNVFDEFVNYINSEGKIYFAEKNYTNLIIKKGLYSKVRKINEMPFKLLREFTVWY